MTDDAEAYRPPSANALRAAVLGANDGLVSILSLVMGVAGGGLSKQDILVAGLAGLLAGACSMAMGEWVSVQSAREMFMHEIDRQRTELRDDPAGERRQLVGIYEAKGLNRREARAVADRVLADPAVALDTMAREELGVDPNTLGGSAWQAAAASFGLFVVGAIPPLLPFAVLGRDAAVVASVVLSGAMLFAIGAAITRLTARPAWRSGLRQLVIGLLAAAVTFGIGNVVGVAVG